ncbi:OTU2 [[Candida] subhashii]|uniref:OTU2 n=1 Tax=[Candida] subhashii TaxID=561895 RepID=A0A8J5UW94_9ASCO|nr:OTU2 [[Candida] subhashii]KAG7661489.1 OTU2 [[Candida] subhashii]
MVAELPSTREELIQRHKKESKDLIATITGLKKQATKKTRKSVLSKCQELEENLQRRHKEELQQFDNVKSDSVNDSASIEDDNQEITTEELLAQLSLSEKQPEIKQEAPAPTTQQPKKRNRQKERLAKRQAEIDRIKHEASIEAANSIDYRKIEIESMDQLLALHHLKLFEIKPDGHCLFASIQDQLAQRHEIEKSVQELRDLAAEYIDKNRNDFVPFLFDESTCEIKDIDEYLKELTTTAMWGSDMEILALSKTFNCPISVYIAGASTLKINPEGEGKELKLGYYKHSYGLGEHYNSLRDFESS